MKRRFFPQLFPTDVRISTAVLFFFFALMFPSSSYAISVYIQNSQKADHPGAVLEITNVKGVGVSGNQKMLVMPGEKKHVYARHVTSFVLSQVFGDYKMLYEIKCPEDMRIHDIITIGMDEIDKNTIGAGCEVARKGRWSLESGTAWQPKKK